MTLIFKKQYIEKITSGKKTVTRRKSRPMVKVGCTYNIRINFFNHLPDRIRVELVYSQRLCEMTYQDALKGGAVTSLKEFRREWAELYGA
jgi:hypothetical protein